MIRIVLVFLAALLAAPLWALDIENMTPEERNIFRQEVRAYLLDNPEVIFEAVEVYEQRYNIVRQVLISVP